MMLEDHVLRVDAAGQPAADADAPHLQRIHRETLRGEDVAHLRRADAERDGAERAVRRGVAVAAGDGHPRLREPQLGPDDVHDALDPAREIEQPDPGGAAVALQRRQHVLGHDVQERPPLVERGNDVIDRADRALGKAHPPSPRAQHVERLRRRHLVDEMEADEKLGLPVRQPPDRVRVPDLLEQSR